jgi:hypothetical protein
VRLRDTADVAVEVAALEGREFYLTDDVVMLTSKRIARSSDDLFHRLAEVGPNKMSDELDGLQRAQPFHDLLSDAGTKSLYFTLG